MNKLYCCYSVSLRDFLKRNNVRYEICGLNPNNHQMFWVYFRDEKLDRLLFEWSSAKRQAIFCMLNLEVTLYEK